MLLSAHRRAALSGHYFRAFCHYKSSSLMHSVHLASMLSVRWMLLTHCLLKCWWIICNVWVNCHCCFALSEVGFGSGFLVWTTKCSLFDKKNAPVSSQTNWTIFWQLYCTCAIQRIFLIPSPQHNNLRKNLKIHYCIWKKPHYVAITLYVKTTEINIFLYMF